MTRERVEQLVARAKAGARNMPLSLRLSPEEHGRLRTAAKRLGGPAATLAHVLIVSGLEDLEAKK
jgi:predicted DNA-binding protein